MKSLCFWSFALAICLLSAPLRAQDFESAVRSAVALQEAGDYEGAARAYRDALSARPDDIAAHVNLGVVLVQLGRFDDAIEQYRTAEKLLPGDPRIELNIALAYQKSGRQKQAREILDKLHASQPDEPKYTLLLADSELQLGNDARVIALLEPLASQNDNELGLAYMLGMAYLRSGKTEQAEKELDRILRNGDSAEAHFLQGTRLFEAGDYPAAVKELGRAAELKPALPQVQSWYGRALLNTGDPDSAMAAFQKELALNANDYGANLGLAQILVARRQPQQARPLLERALEERPDAPDAQLAYAECLLQLREYLKAQELAENAGKRMPQSIEAHQALEAIYNAEHRNAAAKQERETARRLESVADPGPAVGSLAPGFDLADAHTGQSVRLSDLRARQPVALVFGSYTCPNFRGSADTLNSLYGRYRGRAAFLLVYIREAHASDNWQSTRNQGEDAALAPAASMAEKQEHATMCTRKLHLAFPAVVDGMDGAAEKAYRAWPSRVFVIDRAGRVRYSSRLTELDFRPEEMETALRQAIK